MGFRVIEGGLSAVPSSGTVFVQDEAPSCSDVEAEAARRIRATGYEVFRNRETLTGSPVPREVGYIAMQIRYAAEAIARLADIPQDFRSDAYWPS